MRSASNGRSSHPHSASAALRTNHTRADQAVNFACHFAEFLFGETEAKVFDEVRGAVPPNRESHDRRSRLLADATGLPVQLRPAIPARPDCRRRQRQSEGASASRTPRRRAGVSPSSSSRTSRRPGRSRRDRWASTTSTVRSVLALSTTSTDHTTPRPMRCADKAERTASRLAARLYVQMTTSMPIVAGVVVTGFAMDSSSHPINQKFPIRYGS